MSIFYGEASLLNLARGVNYRLFFKEESGIDEYKISTKNNTNI